MSAVGSGNIPRSLVFDPATKRYKHQWDRPYGAQLEIRDVNSNCSVTQSVLGGAGAIEQVSPCFL